MPRSDLRALVRGGGVHLGALTQLLASRYRDRPAIDDPEPVPGLDTGGVRSFQDIEDGVARLAGAHAAQGVEHGQRVPVVTANRLDVGLHVFALARVGAVAVPVNHRLTATEVAAIAQRALDALSRRS